MNDSFGQSPNSRGRLRRIFTGLLVAGAIFVLGVGVGSGNIDFARPFADSNQNQELPDNLDYSSVDEVYRTLRADYDGQLDIEDIMDGLKEGLARSTGDPYTEYLTREDYQDFSDELSGTFTGIGAELTKEENLIVVVAPISGYPAEEAGLRPRDAIIEIDSRSAYDISVTEAVNRIRGPKGTVVELKVIRDEQEELTIEIERDNINIPSVEASIEDGIGVLEVSRFGEDTKRLSEEAAEWFIESEVEGIVLDLRNNPGGLLESSVELADLWLPRNTLVLTERRGDTIVRSINATDQAPLEGIPTVVLINEGSASASEITAGALKDHDAAILVGANTFGKGSVQQLNQLRGGGVLKITIARWFTPGGKNIDQEGVGPDKAVELTAKDLENDRDPQMKVAIRELSK